MHNDILYTQLVSPLRPLLEANNKVTLDKVYKYQGDKSKNGKKNLSWFACKNKWRARIMINKVNRHIGYYDTVKDAQQAIKDFRSANCGT